MLGVHLNVALSWLLGRVLRLKLDLYLEDTACDVVTYFVEHCIKFIEAVDLVFSERILAAVRAEIDCLAETVEEFKLVKPLLVDELDVLVADEHVEIGFADEHFLFGKVVLKQCDNRILCKLVGSDGKSEHAVELVNQVALSVDVLAVCVLLVLVKENCKSVLC